MIWVGRTSYTQIASLPAWGLFDAEDLLVASVRAEDAFCARDLFRQAGLNGKRVRKLP